jgi:hypothetical protein
MYRVVAVCNGVVPSCAEEAARDITAAFAAYGDLYQSVRCDWNGAELVLRVESDWDEDGELTADYFQKCVFANARELAPNGGVSIQSVEQVEVESDDSEGTEGEGYELLAHATKLEIQGRVQEALLAYQRVARRCPHTGAGHDARKSIESLRAKIG